MASLSISLTFLSNTKVPSKSLAEELSHIRAGRANVAILDGVRVNSYGSMVPLNQVANITTPDARTIAIRPWDKKAIKRF